MSGIVDIGVLDPSVGRPSRHCHPFSQQPPSTAAQKQVSSAGDKVVIFSCWSALFSYLWSPDRGTGFLRFWCLQNRYINFQVGLYSGQQGD